MNTSSSNSRPVDYFTPLFWQWKHIERCKGAAAALEAVLAYQSEKRTFIATWPYMQRTSVDNYIEALRRRK